MRACVALLKLLQSAMTGHLLKEMRGLMNFSFVPQPTVKVVPILVRRKHWIRENIWSSNGPVYRFGLSGADARLLPGYGLTRTHGS